MNYLENFQFFQKISTDSKNKDSKQAATFLWKQIQAN